MTRATDFLSLHRPGDPLLMPNPWDIGSAKLLEALGFGALATTSGGFALTLGRTDGEVSRDEALAHSAAVAAAVEVPINADLEDAFGGAPEEVADTMRLVPATGVAGCSIEDWHDGTILDRSLATERVRAAKEALGDEVVLVARADGFIHGHADVDEVITRLTAFEDAGADVLYAPFVTDPDHFRAILSSVHRPLNALLRPDGPSARELADLGVARISVGAAFTQAAYGALSGLAEDLRSDGRQSYFELAARGNALAVEALSGS